MADAYLQALMRGEILTSKKIQLNQREIETDRFVLAREKQINLYLDTLSFESEPGQNQLLSPQLKRAARKNELNEALKLPELSEHITSAIASLADEGKQYLDSAAYDSMIAHLSHAADILEELDLETPLAETFNKILDIDDDTTEAILKIASAKFAENQYSESLSLFVFLTVLQPLNPDLWYRTAIVAQQCGNYTLALSDYAIAANLNQELLGAHLFASECHLKLNQLKEAKIQYEEAKDVIESGKIPIDSEWNDLLSYIEKLVNSST